MVSTRSSQTLPPCAALYLQLARAAAAGGRGVFVQQLSDTCGQRFCGANGFYEGTGRGGGDNEKGRNSMKEVHQISLS